MPSLLSIVLIAMSAVFAWEAYRGLSKGITRFPMQIIGIEQFERGHTMFWGIVGANLVASVGLIALAVWALDSGLP